jgi:hypothetical protein
MPIRSLDDRVLPVGAAAVRRALAAVDRARERLLGLPPLAALVAAVLAAGIGGAVLAQPGVARPAARASCGGWATGPTGVTTIGPRPGQSVTGYLTDAACRLDALLIHHPFAPVAAEVALHSPTGVRAGLALVRPLRVLAAFVGRPGDGLNAQELPVTGGAAGLAVAIRSVAATDRAEAAVYVTLVHRLRTDPRLRPTVSFYRRLARAFAAAAAALTGRCTCVLALVVRGDAESLHSLTDRPDVRTVDPAPAGSSYPRLVFLPLLPGETGRVPAVPRLLRGFAPG